MLAARSLRVAECSAPSPMPPVIRKIHDESHSPWESIKEALLNNLWAPEPHMPAFKSLRRGRHLLGRSGSRYRRRSSRTMAVLHRERGDWIGKNPALSGEQGDCPAFALRLAVRMGVCRYGALRTGRRSPFSRETLRDRAEDQEKSGATRRPTAEERERGQFNRLLYGEEGAEGIGIGCSSR